MGYFLWFCLLGAITTGVCALLFLTLGLEHRYGRATLLSILIGAFISLLTSRPAFFGTGLFPAEAGIGNMSGNRYTVGPSERLPSTPR